MDDKIKSNLRAGPIWIRLLYMILFAFVLYVALGVFAVVVLVQFVITLITGSSNSKLLSFSDVLGQYIFQCVQFESFVSESKPFPFDDFPESKLKFDTSPSEDEAKAEESAEAEQSKDVEPAKDEKLENPSAEKTVSEKGSSETDTPETDSTEPAKPKPRRRAKPKTSPEKKA